MKGGAVLAPEVPATPEAAEKWLASFERLSRARVRPQEELSELATFLGANGAAWTVGNRARLRALLASQGEGVFFALIERMRALPRTDVFDQVELVLRALPSEAYPGMRLRFENRSLPANIRACFLRAAVRSCRPAASAMLAIALKDSEPELREASASLLGECALEGARRLLEARLKVESSSTVRESIAEALESLEP